MSKTFTGLLKAHCPGRGKDGKPKYVTIGSAFVDSGDGRVSFKIDSLPLPGEGWSGWCNVFQPTEYDERRASPPGGRGPSFADDDIPF